MTYEKWDQSLSLFFNASSSNEAESILGELYDSYDQEVATGVQIKLPPQKAKLCSLKKAMLFQFWSEKKPAEILPKLISHLEESLTQDKFDESALSAIVYLRCQKSLSNSQKKQICETVKDLIKRLINLKEKSPTCNSLIVEGLITLNMFSCASDESKFYVSLAPNFPEDYVLQLFQQFGNQKGWGEVPQATKNDLCQEFENYVKDKIRVSGSTASINLAIPFLLETMDKLDYSSLKGFQLYLRKSNIPAELPPPLPQYAY